MPRLIPSAPRRPIASTISTRRHCQHVGLYLPRPEPKPKMVVFPHSPNVWLVYLQEVACPILPLKLRLASRQLLRPLQAQLRLNRRQDRLSPTGPACQFPLRRSHRHRPRSRASSPPVQAAVSIVPTALDTRALYPRLQPVPLPRPPHPIREPRPRCQPLTRRRHRSLTTVALRSKGGRLLPLRLTSSCRQAGLLIRAASYCLAASKTATTCHRRSGEAAHAPSSLHYETRTTCQSSVTRSHGVNPIP